MHVGEEARDELDGPLSTESIPVQLILSPLRDGDPSSRHKDADASQRTERRKLSTHHPLIQAAVDDLTVDENRRTTGAFSLQKGKRERQLSY